MAEERPKGVQLLTRFSRCPRETCEGREFEGEAVGSYGFYAKSVGVVLVKCTTCGAVVGAFGVQKE
jgi:hypothetical protein